ncbi:hypothetical protein ENUP19_0298G0100 [Entamoeba nuttalli]|uniref:Uncharacterized protein n=1 Tax=Entamoeba nuttalli TaxID=412467 RepID=A0ABQ0DUW9_9EUKA
MQMLFVVLLLTIVRSQPVNGQPEQPVPHPPVIPLTPELQLNAPISNGPTPNPIQKTNVNTHIELLPTAGQLLISTATLACRQLDSQYKSTLDGEKQLYARILDYAKKEKQAAPNDLIDIRKKVDDLNLSMLKLKKQRVRLSEEMGDILRTLPLVDQQHIIDELGLQKKVDLYKNVMVILDKEKKQKAKEDKIIFELDVRDAIEKANEKTQVEREVANEQKKTFYVKITEAQTIADKIREYMKIWNNQLKQLSGKTLCKFQVMESLNQTAVNAHNEIVNMRAALKEAKQQRKLVWKTLKNGMKKTITELKDLKKSTQNIKKQNIVKSEINKVEKEIKQIKKVSELKPLEKQMENVESQLSKEFNQLTIRGVNLIKNSNSKCKDNLIGHLDNEKAMKLFKRLDHLETKFKRV